MFMVRAMKQRWMDTWMSCSLRPAPQNREILHGGHKPKPKISNLAFSVTEEEALS